MKFSQIQTELEPFKELIRTIPMDQIQGIKAAQIMLLKIEELLQELAVKDERIDYLSEELFGKK